MQNGFEQAYMLHTRPYRESSLLATFFSREQGKLTLLCRGVKRSSVKYRSLLQPFLPLLIQYGGRSELKILYQLEPDHQPNHLFGRAIRSGIYLNELLLYCLEVDDPHPSLYDAYHFALGRLAQGIDQEMVLRLFEKYLLSALGYALPLDVEVSTGLPISSNSFYTFHPQQGFTLAFDSVVDSPLVFLGSSLLAMANDNFSTEQVLKDAKRLMRLALQAYLGNRPLKSRELFYLERGG